MVEHVAATDPEIHEPKGVSTATSGTVYIAGGTGSGVWTPLVNSVPLVASAIIEDISTAKVVYLPVPFNGVITKIVGTLNGAITGSDSTITLKNSAGATMGTLTVVATGSAAGDTYSASISVNNAVTSGGYFTIETDGVSTDIASFTLVTVLERT